ncbi:hypothetical protein TBC1_112124 [Lentimicrobium saccharophilum]|uniref:Lipoprotein n=1 Tax=Lentimicrobium saccharophilum TaxID=1678841 RepID=A0A0S7BU46_9BACT|nr:hypothetical protein [Lentimicrobium saccharophilum]GAP43965.1 hypothetical protein TBC1_112124 [Lentimicrobium saccharophilum]
MKKIVIYLTLILIFGCRNSSNILPDTELKFVSDYHCWPYDVNIYSVKDIKIDSLFYTYPLNGYFGKNPKYKITTWSKYDEIDTTVWSGMNNILGQCDDNTELYNQILKGDDIYYSGIYQDFKVENGEKRRKYEQILFLDLAQNKLHIFKDINKIY